MYGEQAKAETQQDNAIKQDQQYCVKQQQQQDKHSQRGVLALE
jgi:hypothetical protein